MPTLSKTRYMSLLPHLIRYCSQKPQTQNMLTPKHAGFVHTLFLISSPYCLQLPTSYVSTWSADNWSTQDNSLHLDLFVHSLNTPKTLIYMVTCVFLWLPVRDQNTNDFTSAGYIFYTLSL